MSDMQRSSARDTALEVLMQVSRANAWSCLLYTSPSPRD